MSRAAEMRGRAGARSGRAGPEAPGAVALAAAWRVRADCLRALGVPLAECVSTAKLVIRCEAGRNGAGSERAEARLKASIEAKIEAGGETRAIDPGLLGLNGHATLEETADGTLHAADPAGFAMTIERDASGEAGREGGLVYVRLPNIERCGGGRYQLLGGWVEEAGTGD